MAWGWGYRPYVPVARRRAQAISEVEKLRKKGADIQPVRIEGRKIAHTFWGQAWCQHLEKFSDYSNRLPRGRTYVRNGSVCHLDVQKGKIAAKVSGSHLYNVNITIKALPRNKWNGVRERCAGQVGSVLELLPGRISNQVMSVVTDRDKGLFLSPRRLASTVPALTGPTCASMWRPSSTARAHGLIRIPSFFFFFAASITRISSARSRRRQSSPRPRPRKIACWTRAASRQCSESTSLRRNPPHRPDHPQT